MDPPAETSAGKDAHIQLQYVVRCGVMRTLGVMDAAGPLRYGDKVVVLSSRGTELGTVLCEATPAAIDHMEEPTEGKILRLASSQDQTQCEHLATLVDQDREDCQKFADRLNLKMELVDVERILGGEKIVVYFLAEQRVDFRQLVRQLATHFQTRIEMRQIGVRDQAKVLADYGDCGQPICCARFLSKMPPVSMKMAKLQKATLDPAKISGRCGRLKCCLRYEFDHYQQQARQLPNPGSLILTRDGNATVLAQNILAGQLVIRTEDHRRMILNADDVVSVIRHGDDPTKPRGKKNGKPGTSG